MSRAHLTVLGVVLCTGVASTASQPAPSAAVSLAEEASQTVTPNIVAPPGFRVDRIYTVPRNQGSWVSMAVDPKGRLITSDQFGKLYRVTLAATPGPALVEPIEVDAGSAQGLLWAFDSLYVVVNRTRDEAGNGSGVYRLRDTDGDDRLDEVRLLRELDGSGEHGPHAIVPGPDGRSLYLIAGNATRLPEYERSLVPECWQEDAVLPRLGQTDGLFTRSRPGGWIVRMDPDGRELELVAIGFRNPYDLAFNAAGELFTFDSDMEWDMGTPWYRPTRVLHVVSGADFGWRTGSNKWPDDYIDSLPAVVDVGASSPTGLVFGDETRFPEKHRRALFMADWSYGKIYALHLKPRGSGFGGEFESFLSGSPLPVTDLVVRPQDGALYFLTGGRQTASGLYRVAFAGEASPESGKTDNAQPTHTVRHELERLHRSDVPNAVRKAWPHLDHKDPFIRHAARVAVEHQPVESWRARALAEENPRRLLSALTALARHGSALDAGPIVKALSRLDWEKLGARDRLDLLRVGELVIARMIPLPSEVRGALLALLDRHYPTQDARLDRELCQILVALEAPNIVARTLSRISQVDSQEEQLFYILALRHLPAACWSLEQNRRYFEWLNETTVQPGGVSYAEFLRQIRQDAIAQLPEDRRGQLGSLLMEPLPEDPYAALQAREQVKAWTVADFLNAGEALTSDRDFDQGRRTYAAAMCIRCHRFNGRGGMTGPDLTGVGNRFDLRTLLESMFEPSRMVSDQFNTVEVVTNDGDSYVGRIGDINEEEIFLMVDLINPAALETLAHDDIEEIISSSLSMMPTALLDTFTRDEILDLIAYLRSQGDPEHPVFGDE